jgi:hypothetical protein
MQPWRWRLLPPPNYIRALPAPAMPDGHFLFYRSSGGDWGHLVSVRHSDYPNQLQPHVCQLFRGLDRSLPAGEEAGVRRPPVHAPHAGSSSRWEPACYQYLAMYNTLACVPLGTVLETAASPCCLMPPPCATCHIQPILEKKRIHPCIGSQSDPPGLPLQSHCRFARRKVSFGIWSGVARGVLRSPKRP